MRWLLAALAAVTLTLPAVAQNVHIAQMTGQALQYLEQGAVNGCGLRVIGVRDAGEGFMEASEISVNVYSTGQAIVKAIAYAPMRTSKRADLREVKVASSWARAPGSRATTVSGASFPGDSSLSLLHVAELRGAFAFLLAGEARKPVQFMVQRVGGPEYVLAGTVELAEGESAQLSQCMRELVANLKAAASGMPK